MERRAHDARAPDMPSPRTGGFGTPVGRCSRFWVLQTVPGPGETTARRSESVCGTKSSRRAACVLLRCSRSLRRCVRCNGAT